MPRKMTLAKQNDENHAIFEGFWKSRYFWRIFLCQNFVL